MCNYIKKNNRYCKNYNLNTYEYCYLHSENDGQYYANNFSNFSYILLQLTASLLLMYFIV